MLTQQESFFDKSSAVPNPEFRAVRKLRRILLTVEIVLLPFTAISENPEIATFALLELLLFTWLLWSPSRPPILFFAWLMQWMQSSLLVFSLSIQGVSLSNHPNAGLTTASWLALLSSLALGYGMSIPSRFKQTPSWNPNECNSIPLFQFAFLYLAMVASTSALTVIAWTFTGITQLVLTIAYSRWAVIYLLFISTLTKQKGYWLALLVILIEIAIGFLGYFGDFRHVIIVFLVALLSSNGSRRLIWMTVPIAALGVALLLVWTSIKAEYRAFVNKGGGLQLVLVTDTEKVERLVYLCQQLTKADLVKGADALVNRIAYVDLLSKTIQYVPNIAPHEEGNLWKAAIRHVLIPRLFDPDKPSLDDSALARRYTGISISGKEEGTSIGLGYVAESYVDFGRYGMFVPSLLLGLWLGWIHWRFQAKQFFQPLGVGFLVAIVVLNANSIEISSAKLLGSQVTMALIFFVLLAFGTRMLSKTSHQPID